MSLLAASLAISVFFIELYVRMEYPELAPEGMIEFHKIENDVIVAKNRNQTTRQFVTGEFNVEFAINELGFRDDKNLSNSSAGDIFVVGDSFSIGHGVEQHERYSDILETELHTATKQPKVFNISIPVNILGYKKLIDYSRSNGGTIKNLIVGICMQNDFDDFIEGNQTYLHHTIPEDGEPLISTLKGLLKRILPSLI